MFNAEMRKSVENIMLNAGKGEYTAKSRRHNIMAADVSGENEEEDSARLRALNPDVAFDGGLN